MFTRHIIPFPFPTHFPCFFYLFPNLLSLHQHLQYEQWWNSSFLILLSFPNKFCISVSLHIYFFTKTFFDPLTTFDNWKKLKKKLQLRFLPIRELETISTSPPALETILEICVLSSPCLAPFRNLTWGAKPSPETIASSLPKICKASNCAIWR